MGEESWIVETSDGVRLNIDARPRASRTQVCGLHDGRLKIQLASPPVDGKANEALIEFLAGVFGCGKRDVTIVSGDRGKRKSVLISSRTRGDVLNSEIGEAVASDAR